MGIRTTNADYKTNFEPDWEKYPHLLDAFESAGSKSWREELNGELNRLLVEARADAVRFVNDVKSEELAKAREETREMCARIADRNDQSAWGIAREIRAQGQPR